jgi:hypothetical protein
MDERYVGVCFYLDVWCTAVALQAANLDPGSQDDVSPSLSSLAFFPHISAPEYQKNHTSAMWRELRITLVGSDY